MKKVFFSLFAAWSLMIGGATMVDAARVSDNFNVRICENTLVVTGTQMEEARLFDEEGRLLNVERGRFCEFDLPEKGTYRLMAKVDNRTRVCKVILR